jgi:hypothetical protein
MILYSMDISWECVRRVILDDRINGYKPDRPCLDKLSRVLPDCRVVGFMKYYEKHWCLIVESRKAFIPSDDPLLGFISLTSLINRLANGNTLQCL